MLKFLHFFLILLISVFATGYSSGQEKLHLNFDLTFEGVISSGSFAPYMVTVNRHDILSSKPNSGNLQIALSGDKCLNDRWSLSGGLNVLTCTDSERIFYLQELYLKFHNKNVFFEIGSRQQSSPVLNNLLTSGDLVFSGNARTMPMILFSSKDFIHVPFTRNQVEAYFDYGYGKLLDGDWIENRFLEKHLSDKFTFYTRNVYFHHKQLYLRSNSKKTIYGTIGINHAVFFSGKKTSYETGKKEISGRDLSFGDFFRVIIPKSDDTETVAGDSFVFGNHVGNWYLDFAARLTSTQSLKMYMEKPFEDGSGIAFRNGLDGLWGIEYSADGNRYIKGCVVEYVQTTNQSGPIHWAPADADYILSHKLPNEATGADNYYNNFFYNGYAHYGMSIGSALLKSPYYNSDGYLNYIDNRIQAWHFGMNGELSSSLSYLLKASYREGLGTYFIPLNTRHHSFDTIVQLSWSRRAWKYSASYALTRGNVYGNSQGANIKMSYHGKIL